MLRRDYSINSGRAAGLGYGAAMEKISNREQTVYLIGGDDEPQPITVPIPRALSKRELQSIEKALREKFPDVQSVAIQEHRLMKNPYVPGATPISVSLVLAIYIGSKIVDAALTRLGENIGDFVSKLIKVLPDDQPRENIKSKKTTKSTRRKRR